MKALVKATLAVSIGASALMVAPESKAVSYTVGGTVSSTADTPPAGQRKYTLDTNVLNIGPNPATGDAATAFGNFFYNIFGGPVNATCNAAGKSCPLSWATPLTVALPATSTFGTSITFDNPLVTRTNPLGAVGSNTFAGFGTFTTSTGKTGSLSFTVNPASTWGGTLDLNVGVPGPLPAVGVVAGLGFARRMRRQLKATV
ncbi:MAG: hypothetical protein ACOYMY_02375 [Prochlorococcaceae cyanobacterium]